MRDSKLRNIIKKITSSGNRVKLITFIGLLAMLLIFLSEVIPKSSTGKAAAESEQSRDMSGDYVSGMEERLGKLLAVTGQLSLELSTGVEFEALGLHDFHAEIDEKVQIFVNGLFFDYLTL